MRGKLRRRTVLKYSDTPSRARFSRFQKAHEYFLKKSSHYHKWHCHPHHQKVHFAGLAASIIAITLGSIAILFPAGFAKATAYNFSQTSWAGGADVAATANHTSNQSNWTKYYSASSLTATTNVKLTLTPSTAAETTATHFSAGTHSSTVESGAGDAGTVVLDQVAGANAWTTVSTTGAPASYAKGNGLTIGNTIYVTANAMTTFYLYNPVADTWSVGPNLPTTCTNACPMATDGTDIFYYNQGTYNTFYKYTIATNTWTQLSMTSGPTSSSFSAQLAYVSGKVYLEPGVAANCAQPDSNIFVYDVSGDSWSTLANVPLYTKLAGCGGGISAYNNILYFPSANAAGSDIRTLSSYTPATTTWTTLASRSGVNTTAPGSYPLAYSGHVFFPKEYDGLTFYDYNISTDTWTTGADLPATTGANDNQGVDFYGWNGNVYFLRSWNGLYHYKYVIAGYQASGNYISQTIDLSSKASFGNLDFTVTTPASTTLQFQLAANNDNSTWSYLGPDGTAGTYYSSTGTAIASALNGSRYVRYKAFLTSTDIGATPTLSDITINYSKYAASGTLISSPYDSLDPTNILNQMTWTETLASGDIKFQIRTALDNGSGAPGTWSDWLGPTSTSDYYTDPAGAETINSTHSTGTNDEWVQYQVFLSTTDTSSTPTMSNFSLGYILNTSPTATLTNSPAESSAGVYTITYDLTDPEETSVNVYLTAGFGATLASGINSADVTATLTADAGSAYTYLPTGGGTLLIGNEMITYTSRSGTALSGLSRAQLNTVAASHAGSAAIYLRVTTGISGDTGSVLRGSGKSISWTLATTLANLEIANGTIKLFVNDGNLANQVNSAETSALVMDSKAPTAGAIVLDSRLNSLTLTASDSNAISMKLSNNSGLLADGSNADSGNWIAYSGTKAWTPSTAENRTETVYASYKDAYGNATGTINTTTGANPVNVLIQDTSNSATSSWRLFISWDAVSNPSEGFDHYEIYRSTDNNTYSALGAVNTRLTNYYVDSGLNNAIVYYYKITTVDSHANESNYSTPSSSAAQSAQSGTGLMPNGAGGGDYTAPVVSIVAAGTPTTTGVTITWTTDEASNSDVGYSTDTNYLTEAGVPTMTTSHSVALSNLSVATKYYFRVISYDASGNKATTENSETQFFTTAADTTGPVISNITVTPGTTSAGVVWSTNESSTSVVHYGLTSGLGSTQTVATPVTGHAVTLSSLTSNTTYYYNVASTDTSGNPTTSDTTTFTTTATGYESADVTAPSISAVSAGSLTTSSAVITWTTNESANSTVGYSTDTNYLTEAGVPTMTTSHSVSLSNLSPNTTYYFKVVSYDSTGNRGSSTNSVTQNFTTSADSTGPVQSNISVVVGTTSAGVVWSTDEASNSVVESGLTNSLGTTTTVGTLVSGHAVTLSSLTSNTTYYYRVKSTDAYNNLTTSSTSTFTTAATGYEGADVTAPSISAVVASGLSPSSATITWTTNESATSTVGYSTDTGYATETGASGLATSHSVTLPNLAAATKYYFRIISYDSTGNKGLAESSSTQNFTTSADTTAPTISNTLVVVGTITAGVAWSTNEASDSLVEYGLTSNLGSSTSSTTLVSGHAVTLTGLTNRTKYYYRVKSTDASSNLSTGSISDFTTASTGSEDADVTAPTISGVTVSSISNTGALISYTLSENGLGRIIYGTSTAYGAGANEGNNTYETSKTTTLAGLTVNTTYHYKISAVDAAGNLGSSGDTTFTTTAEVSTSGTTLAEATAIVEAAPDPTPKESVTAPKITSEGPSVTTISEKSATISWTTDKRSTSSVLFRPAGSDVDFSTAGDTNYSRSHDVTLVLEPSQLYEYKIQSADISGNLASSNLYNFVTLSGTVSSVQIGDVSESAAKISWQTAALSIGTVEYNSSLDSKSRLASSDNLGRNHSVALSDLIADEHYNFTVVMKTERGDIIRSNTYSFSTLADKNAPSITNVQNRTTLVAGSNSAVQLVLTWTTNKPADGIVTYAANNLDNKSVTSTPISTDFVLSHTVVVSNLKPSTMYQYYIISKDKAGHSVKSDKFNLLTPAPNANIIDLIFDRFKKAFGWASKL